MGQSRLSGFLRYYRKDVIGFGIYYGIVGAAAAAEALLGWNLALPMALLLVWSAAARWPLWPGTSCAS